MCYSLEEPEKILLPIGITKMATMPQVWHLGAWIFAVAVTTTSCSALLNDQTKVLDTEFYSNKSGLYSSPFWLELHGSRNDIIRYTLDGSPVTEASTRYERPLYIKEIDYGILSDPLKIFQSTKYLLPISSIVTNPIEEEYGNRYKGHFVPWVLPSGRFKAAPIVRAARFNVDGIKIVEETRQFFFDPIHFKQSLPVVSLIVNPEDLFNYNTGIFVPGKAFDLEPEGVSGNYSLGTEIAGEFSFFQDGVESFHTKVGVRVGGQNRNTPIKSFRIFARDYYGLSWFKSPLIPGVETLRRFDLRNGGIPEFQHAYFTDYLAQSLLGMTDLDFQKGQPAVMFLNGEYWGVYILQERQDEYYLQTRYNLSDQMRDNLDVYDSGTYYVGDSTHWDSVRRLIDLYSSLPSISDETVSEITSLVDTDNLNTVFASQLYFANVDWPGFWNERRWRNRTAAHNELAGAMDGRWRWMIFDIDAGFGSAWTTPGQNVMAMLDDKAYPMSVLLRNVKYRFMFINKVLDMLNATFRPEIVRKRIDEKLKPVEEEMKFHIARWGYPKTIQHWYDSVERIRDFASLRPNILRQHLRDTFSASRYSTDIGATRKVCIHLERSDTGSVRLNSIVIDSQTPSFDETAHMWIGDYFEGVPITLLAIPVQGYRFSHWKETGIKDNPITRKQTEDAIYTPVFEKDS